MLQENRTAKNLLNNQEILQLIIFSFTLMTLMCDSGVMLKGEIRYQLLSGIKVLLTYTFSCICFLHFLATMAKIVRKAYKQVNRRQ